MSTPATQATETKLSFAPSRRTTCSALRTYTDCTYSFKEGDAAVDRLAWHYSKLDICPKVATGEVPPVHVISVLTSSSIDETFLEIALAKLGLTSLLLAVNNSVAAVAHLTKLTNATHLIYGAKFEDTAKEARAILAAQDYHIELIPETRFPLWGPQGVASSTIEPFAPYLTPDQEASRPGVVLHSSGSTGFPKPVYLPHAAIVYLAAQNRFSSVFSTLPLFHAAGHFLMYVDSSAFRDSFSYPRTGSRASTLAVTSASSRLISR